MLGAKSKLMYSKIAAFALRECSLKATDTTASQNIDFSSWNEL
jgi:hypothetical protein